MIADPVVKFLFEKDKIKGSFVKVKRGVWSVNFTTGTFLNGLIHIGEKQIPAGRYDEKPSRDYEQLEKLTSKFKT